MKETTNWQALLKEAFILARAAGFRPAQLQRSIDIRVLVETVEMIRHPEFAWKSSDDGAMQAIITSPGRDGWTAIHAGQHRILAGLLCDNPVPPEMILELSFTDATRDWEDHPVSYWD